MADSARIFAHAHARRAAPSEGVLPTHITEDEAEALDAQHAHVHAAAGHSSGTVAARMKGSKAWVYAAEKKGATKAASPRTATSAINTKLVKDGGRLAARVSNKAQRASAGGAASPRRAFRTENGRGVPSGSLERSAQDLADNGSGVSGYLDGGSSTEVHRRSITGIRKTSAGGAAAGENGIHSPPSSFAKLQGKADKINKVLDFAVADATKTAIASFNSASANNATPTARKDDDEAAHSEGARNSISSNRGGSSSRGGGGGGGAKDSFSVSISTSPRAGGGGGGSKGRGGSSSSSSSNGGVLAARRSSGAVLAPGPPWRQDPDKARNCVLRACFCVAEDKRFDRFILFCILVNSVTLAMYDPRGVSTVDERIPMAALDVVFLAVFFAEMCVKIGAYGVYTTASQKALDRARDLGEVERAQALGVPLPLPVHSRYLDDNWNRLDFFIVLASLTYFLRFLNTSMEQDLDVLRTLRMLRPLRTINSIPEMRILIDSLGESAKPMANVMLLCVFLFLLFALVGQQLFAGALTKRCYRSAPAQAPGSTVYDDFDDAADSSSSSGTSRTFFPAKFVSVNDGVTHVPLGVQLMPDALTSPVLARRCGGDFSCPNKDYGSSGGDDYGDDGDAGEWECRISGRQPHINNEGTTTWGGLDDGGGFANPNFGMTHYDDIGHALLNIFVAVTLEGWVDQMYWLQDSYGRFAALFFFLSLIIIGSLFALNLALAVISKNYSANVQRDTNRLEKAKLEAAKLRSVMMIRQQKQMLFEDEEAKKRQDFERKARQAALEAQIVDSAKSAAANAEVARAAQSVAEAALARDEALVKADIEVGLPIEHGVKLPKGMVVGYGGRPLYRPKDRVRSLCFDVVCSGAFEDFILFLIFLNTLSLAIPHYTVKCLDQDGQEDTDGCIRQGAPMDQSVERLLERANEAFLFAFTAEAVLKIYGLGWGQYAVDSFNVFDLAIVLIGYLENIPFTTLPGGNGIISAFRIFRLARVFKAAKYWPSMQAIIKTLIDTLPSLTYLTIVLFLLMFIAACAGVQLFGDVGIPLDFRANFGDFGTAMLTVFQILTGENWNEVMYMAVGHTHYAFVMYFIVVFVIGGFVILNLYLAILLSAFDAGDAPEFSMDWVHSIGNFICKLCKPSMASRRNGRDLNEEVDDSTMHVKIAELEQITEKNQSLLDTLHRKNDPSLSTAIATKEVERYVLHRQKKTEAIRRALHGTSCFCISKHNRWRLRLARLVHTQAFDNAVLVLIIISTITLAFESPKLTECANDCLLYVVLLYADLVFTALFLLEMTLKVIVYGFISTKSAYLKDPWNVLDFFIVVIGTLSIAFSFLGRGSDIAWIRSLRALRALRPLRTIKRAPGMRMAVNTIFDCAPAFLNIGCVAFVFYLAFAIIGVEFFGGRFWSCNDTTVSNVWECTGSYFEESEYGQNVWVDRKWENPAMNFDNTGQALLTLFEIAGLELWMLPMYSAMDLTSVGKQPQRNNNRFSALYFVFFILFGSFLVMNLFVGAVVDNFNKQTNKDEGQQHRDAHSLKAASAAAAAKSRAISQGSFSSPLPALGSSSPRSPGSVCSLSGRSGSFGSFSSGGWEDAGSPTSPSRMLSSEFDDPAAVGKGSIVTPGQKAFLDAVSLLFSRKPITRPVGPNSEAPFYRQRRWAYNLVMWGPTKTVRGVRRRTLDGSYFEIMIMTVVVLNTIAMLCYTWHYPDNNEFYALGSTGEGAGLPVSVGNLQATLKNSVLDAINNLFTVVFNLEMVLKIAAWGYMQYWHDRWNKLDAFVVLISDVVLVLENASGNFKFPFNPNLVRILRLVKLMRIMRVLSRGKEVIFLIETLVYSFPAIANVAALWFLVIFIYTVIGVSLYGDMAIDGTSYKFGMYNKHANFASFQTGIVTLFRMSTGESWNGIMHDVVEEHPSAWIFFFSYILLVAYLLFNLLVAIVLQQFHMESKDEDEDEVASPAGRGGGDGSFYAGETFDDAWDEFGRDDSGGGARSQSRKRSLSLQDSGPNSKAQAKFKTIGGNQMASFQDEWVRFDPFATEYIKAIELPLILKRLPPELCPLTEDSSTVEVLQTLANLKINVDVQGRIHFAETYIAIIQFAYNMQLQREKHALRARNPLSSGDEESDDEFKEPDEDLTVGTLEGIMGQIVAHYPALATQMLTDKPIVEFFAAQRLQAMWLLHRAQAGKNWDKMMNQLRAMRQAEKLAAAASPSSAGSPRHRAVSTAVRLTARLSRKASFNNRSRAYSTGSADPGSSGGGGGWMFSSLRGSLNKPATGSGSSLFFAASEGDGPRRGRSRSVDSSADQATVAATTTLAAAEGQLGAETTTPRAEPAAPPRPLRSSSNKSRSIKKVAYALSDRDGGQGEARADYKEEELEEVEGGGAGSSSNSSSNSAISPGSKKKKKTPTSPHRTLTAEDFGMSNTKEAAATSPSPSSLSFSSSAAMLGASPSALIELASSPFGSVLSSPLTGGGSGGGACRGGAGGGRGTDPLGHLENAGDVSL